MQTKKLYFAYGANMHPENMAYRCPDATAIQQFNLHNWELTFYSHATILPRDGATTPGVLWAVTNNCEYNLDCFEGYPDYYTKQTWIQDGVEFFFYEMTQANKSGTPNRHYVKNIADSYDHWGIEAITYACYS